MSTLTPYIGLTKPSGADQFDNGAALAVFNRNYDIIDAASTASSFTAAGYGAAGDGVTDDTTALQNMLDDCFDAGGGVCDIGPGTYAITGELEIKPPGCVWIRMTPQTILLRDSNTSEHFIRNYPSTTLESTYDDYGGPGRIRITGGIIDVNGAVNIHNCTGMKLAHADNVIIDGVTFQNVPDWHALELGGCRNARVRNCRFRGFNLVTAVRTNSGAVQIDQVSNSGTGDTYNDDVLIMGCRVTGHGTLGSFGRGFGNHEVGSDGPTNHRVRIVGNYIEGALDKAVCAYAWSESIITGNQMQDCNGAVRICLPSTATSATDLHSIVFSGNVAANVATPDVSITQLTKAVDVDGTTDNGDAVYLDCVIVSDNVMHGYAGIYGVSLHLATNCLVNGNVIDGPTMTSPENTESDAAMILADSCPRSSIVANRLAAGTTPPTGGAGVLATWDSTNNGDQCLIAGNVIDDTSSHGVYSDLGVNQTMVVGNIIGEPGGDTGNAGANGVQVYADDPNDTHQSNNVFISRNTVLFPNNAAVWLSEGSYAAVWANVSIDSDGQVTDEFTGSGGTYAVATGSSDFNYST